jgi:hypothetical protein
MLIEYRRIPVFVLLASALWGCGAQVLDVGSPDAGPPVGHHRDFPPPSNSFGCTPGHENTDCYGTPCTGDVPPELAGPWVGQLSDVTFPSGSAALRIEVKGSQSFGGPESGICGAVIFGTASGPPVATDPQNWPPGTSTIPLTTGPKQQPVEGFRYEFWKIPLSVSALDANGAIPVPIALFSRQVYKSWCELQDSYAQPFPSLNRFRWSCLPPPKLTVDTRRCGEFVPPGPTDAGDHLVQEFNKPPCVQVDLCNAGVCDCDQDGCSIQNLTFYADPDIPFDIRLVPGGNSGTGTITWDGASHTVTLARAPLGAL